MIEKIKKIYSAIQLIPENQLTKTVIKPTLEKLGFLKIEFYGGIDEEGKDLLCWKKDPLGDITLTVAQVKHFKFTNKASGGNSFQNVVNQLTMSLQKRVQYSDKSSHLPEQVYLISSYEIDSKNIKSRFSDYPDINQNRIKIIDGYRLSELILNNCPEIASKLINEEIDLSYYSSENLTNDILLKALGFDKKINLKSIYTDIDFSLGKHTTKLFFNINFKGIEESFSLNNSEWDNFKLNLLTLEKHIVEKILNEKIENIEQEYSLLLIEFKRWSKLYNQAKTDLDNQERNFKKSIAKNQSEWNYFRSQEVEYNQLLIEKKSKKNKKTSQQIKTKVSELKALKNKLKSVFDEEIKVTNLSNKIEFLWQKRVNPKYIFSIKGEEIEAILENDRSYIKKEIKKFNSKTPDNSELKKYLKRCDFIFQRSSNILGCEEFLMALGLSNKIKIRKSLDSTRFKLPIDKIFDTRLNLVLLGEAGAGKTTSLQMYAINNKENDERIILWTPLNRLVHNWSLNTNKKETIFKIKSLDLAICEYLQSKNIKLSNLEILDVFKRKKVVILLDGLDEAIKSNEWLPEAINFLANKYHSTIQIIVTSRMTGDYIEKLKFLTVTLLPFTSEQRNQFINNWFDENDNDAKNKILAHFKKNKSIDETTRNPLLTTTLCVLAQHKLPLPNTEINLYDNRLKLLAGYYDNVKNIPSRVSTTPDNLEYLAKKIAFYLHSKNIREIERKRLEEISIKCMSRILSPLKSKNALKELIDPCNILVPMTETGKYGFGHLRYQEHLAASELIIKREANIQYLMSQNWWRETLFFFSQMCDDLTWLARSNGFHIGDKNFLSMLNEMKKYRPVKERKEIDLLIKEYTRDFSLVYNENDFYDFD